MLTKWAGKMVAAVFVTAGVAASVFVYRTVKKIAKGEFAMFSRQGMLKSKLIQKLAGGRLERIGNNVLSSAQMRFLRMHKDPQVLSEMKDLRKQLAAPLANEAFLLRSLAQSMNQMPGDFAEVGCFQGGSAAMICKGKADKVMHLFDTFEGIPKGREDYGEHFKENLYSCSLENVKANLVDYSNLKFHKGIFPASIEGNEQIANTSFSFVNIDVDLYEGTLECLKFFYPRMTPGGILISHDYMLEGVRAAFDQFMIDKPEQLIDLPTTQCMMIKLDNQSAAAITNAAKRAA